MIFCSYSSLTTGRWKQQCCSPLDSGPTTGYAPPMYHSYHWVQKPAPCFPSAAERGRTHSEFQKRLKRIRWHRERTRKQEHLCCIALGRSIIPSPVKFSFA